GRAVGELNADEVAVVLRDIELTGEALTAATTALREAGIEIDGTVADDAPDATPSRGTDRERVGVVLDDDDVERRLARRRRRRGTKRAGRGDAGTSDTVRLYLREIGQVDLLTT